jgi:GT2 family glycosyltransferase
VPFAGTPIAELTRTSLSTIVSDALRATPPDRTVARALTGIRRALCDDLGVALRQVDRAWREMPEFAPIFAPIYARLLALDGMDFIAALRMLDAALESSPDPDLAALRVYALLRLQRTDEACPALEAALHHYCIDPDGLLARVGGELLHASGVSLPGWIGRGSDLSLVGELEPAEPNVLEIRIDGGLPVTHMVAHLSRDGYRRFSLPCPKLDGGKRLAVSCRGINLLGGEAAMQPPSSVDGRVRSCGRRVSGWARVGWLPSTPVTLRVEDEHGGGAELRSARHANPGWRWPFSVNLRAAKIAGNRIHISARFPDGSWHPLPDAPLLLEPAVRGGLGLPLGPWKECAPDEGQRTAVCRAKVTDIIIPVHGGRRETLACIESVRGTQGAHARIVVVDDASEDPELGAALDDLEAAGVIQLLRNAQNLGFVAAANRGLKRNPGHDAVLLNSDTVVFGDWLSRLRAAAYSAPRVGTVTPLSNSGSIASYPHVAGGPTDPPAAGAIHHLAATTFAQARVEIPVGVGFCLFIRRDCLREIGELDVAVFSKGYGEETDFCLRARAKGWSHQLAGDVYVYHAGGVSFGGRRQALMDRSQRLLNVRHPGYDRFIAGFLALDPLHPVRRRLDERRLRAFGGRFVLVVTLALFGGVDRYVTERCRSIKAASLQPLVLRPTAAGKPERCELWTDALEVPNLQFDIPRDLDALRKLLADMNLESVEIQHFMGLDARVVETVRALPVAYDVVVHDYSWICPRVTLIDGSNRYCGEPKISVCQTCVRRNGSKLTENISVTSLRARSAIWLKAARRVIAPSSDAARRLRGYIDDLTVEVRPHTAASLAAPLARRPSRRGALRVALLGAIGTHKGYRVLLECARDARDRELPIEFIVIGHTENDAPLLATGKVFITGRYNEEEAVHLMQREQPDIAWLPSVWPETWCYTLDYALRAALPVAAFNLGAIAERLRSMGVGELMPLDCPAPQINDRLLAAGRRAQVDFIIADKGDTFMPQTRDTDRLPGHITARIPMKNHSNGTESTREKEDSLSASVQVLPLPTGLYLFSVTSAAPPVSGRGELSLPAMHVGLGPGVRSDQVEFIAGPSTHGAWLFSTDDLLVTKINGSGATLILTSVRAPLGDVLSIKVERLAERRDEPASAKAAASTAPAAAGARSRPLETKPLFETAGSALPLPVNIVAHIRTRGDMSFAHVSWAGRVAPGLWIESFSVQPLDRFGAQDIEYKGLTGSGFETPWISDNVACGTRGMATPLVGFAIRLKPSAAAASFDCEYSGYYRSGVVVGPMRNGAPCRSSVANDSLEGIQLRIVERVAATLADNSVSAGVTKRRAAAGIRHLKGSSPPATLNKRAARRQPSSRGQ